MKLSVFVPECGVLPKGYGVAWHDIHRLGAICLPVPLNILAAVCRRMWHWIRVGLKPSLLDSARMDGWVKGRETARVLRTKEERRADFIEGFQYFKAECLSDLDKKPSPLLPEYMK